MVKDFRGNANATYLKDWWWPDSGCSLCVLCEDLLIFLCGYCRNIGVTAEVTEDSAEGRRGNEIRAPPKDWRGLNEYKKKGCKSQ